MSVVRIALALSTGAALAAAHPPLALGGVAWIALVPLIVACEGAGPGEAAVLGFLSGMAAEIGIGWWLRHVPGFGVAHVAGMAAYLSLYPALWCAGIRAFRRLPPGRALLAAPALWVALDFARAHAGFLAFPWATLAQTQQGNVAVLSLASVTGEYGITFLVVLGNVALAGLVLRRAWRGALATAAAILAVHAWGFVEAAHASPAPVIRVAAVQPAIALGEQDTPAGRRAVAARLARLTRIAAASGAKLVAWPETVVAGTPRTNPMAWLLVRTLAEQTGAAILVGASVVEKDPVTRVYNSVFLVTPEGTAAEPYQKRRLLPFGEYLPWAGVLPRPAWLLARRDMEGAADDATQVFTLPDGTRVGALICWESAFDGLSRASVGDGARLLVVLTDDAWFGRSAASAQQNATAVLRAAENRVPVVIASNTGPSMVIDAGGRVVRSAPGAFVESVVVADVRPGTGRTPYNRFGNALVLAAILGLLAAAAPILRLVPAKRSLR